MALFGIRSAVKDRVKRLLGQPTAEDAQAPVSAAAPRAASASPAAPPAPVVSAPVVSAPPAPQPVSAAVAPPPVDAAPAAPAAPEAPRSVSKPDDTDDTAGPPILFEDVQAILDDMVRPALQGDGGDISLLKVEDRRIYVRLVGACSTCPSSIMTMKMGVEALLKEEFPQMEELIQVEA
jgi:Fe-S cluster biogenesis protein NfuA